MWPPMARLASYLVLIALVPPALCGLQGVNHSVEYAIVPGYTEVPGINCGVGMDGNASPYFLRLADGRTIAECARSCSSDRKCDGFVQLDIFCTLLKNLPPKELLDRYCPASRSSTYVRNEE